MKSQMFVMTCEILMTGFGWSISRPVGQQGWLLASFAGTAARNSAQHSTRHWLCHLLSGLDQGEAGSQVHWCWVCAEGLYFSFCCCCNSPQLICCFFQSLASNWKGRCLVRFCVCSCFLHLHRKMLFRRTFFSCAGWDDIYNHLLFWTQTCTLFLNRQKTLLIGQRILQHIV